MGAGLSDPDDLRPRRVWSLRLGLQLALLSAVLLLALWVNLYAAEHDFVREAAVRFGYPGVLAAGVVSGFNLVVPIPLVAFLPFFVDVGMDPVPTVTLIALGMTMGDCLGYLIGHAARDALSPRLRGRMARLERMRRRRPWLPLLVVFLYAAIVPAPNEILVIPLAFLRYPLLGVFAAVLAGNVIFNGLVGLGLMSAFAGM